MNTVKTREECEQFHSWLDLKLFELYMPAWRQYAWQNETSLQRLVMLLCAIACSQLTMTRWSTCVHVGKEKTVQ
jgi:hypothetical protein